MEHSIRSRCAFDLRLPSGTVAAEKSGTRQRKQHNVIELMSLAQHQKCKSGLLLLEVSGFSFGILVLVLLQVKAQV